MAKTHVGTPYTKAPEIYKGMGRYYDNKVDLWSLGIIFYQMLFKDYPFNGKNETELFLCIENT